MDETVLKLKSFKQFTNDKHTFILSVSLTVFTVTMNSDSNNDTFLRDIKHFTVLYSIVTKCWEHILRAQQMKSRM